MNDEPAGARDGNWSFYFALLFVIIIIAFAVSLGGTASRSHRNEPAPDRYNALLRGDVSARLALATLSKPSYSRRFAQVAVESYYSALPWPSAYRRIGVTKQVFLGQPGLRELMSVGGKRAAAIVKPRQRPVLTREAAMWREIYGTRALTKPRAEALAARVRRLNLGPLKEVAAAEVYARAGDAGTANAILQRAERSALLRVGALCLMVAGGAVGAVVGVGLLVWFASRHGSELGKAERPRISGTAFPSFYQFLVFMIGFSALAGQVKLSPAGEIAAAVAASLGAFSLAFVLMRQRAERRGEDCREIGLRPMGVGPALRWGLGGYCAAIPLLIVSLIGALALQNVLFNGQPIREHPIVPVLLSGGPALWLSLVLAVIVAPLVEEVIFRGALYTALRARLNVWGSALLSGAVFSAIHPTMPAGFLPILTLGFVLAILREKTGSLYPSMVCHAANNLAMLLAVVVAY